MACPIGNAKMPVIDNGAAMLRKPIHCFVFLSALLTCFASYDVEGKTKFSWPTIRSEQIPNFTGTYTAPHRGDIYNVIIQTMGTEPQNQRFIIAGFLKSADKILSLP